MDVSQELVVTNRRVQTSLELDAPTSLVFNLQTGLVFDLNETSTWECLRAYQFDRAFWLFPAEPLELVKRFWHNYHYVLGKVVVVGSTSAYEVTEAGATVRESNPLRLTIPRVQGEEFLRSQGAIVVRAAGIYGAGRDPRQWVTRGLIQAGHSYINLIHGRDLARLLMAASRAAPSTQWIASDNHSLRWSTIINRLALKTCDAYDEGLEKPDSKKIDSSFTWSQARLQPIYTTIFEGLHGE